MEDYFKRKNCKYTCYLNGPRYLDFVNYHIAVPQFTNSVSIRQKGQNNYSDAGARALPNILGQAGIS